MEPPETVLPLDRMPMTRAPELDSTLFEDAVDVPLWLEDDRATPYATRVQRDRAIALELTDADPVASVRAWWRRADIDARPDAGRRLGRARTLATLVMLMLGVLTGAGLALAAFQYDGSYPVNVVRLLALLVAPQLVLIALTLLMLPPRVPGLRLLQDALAALNPGALAESLYRRVAPDSLAALRILGTGVGRSASGRFAKWQMLTWSQVAAVAFNVAALITAVLLISFTDLAFGWSTTLAVSPETAARIVDTLAWPWHELVPAAVPGRELIERSQFFRLETATAVAADSRDLAGWWSFTVLALACYGLAPRVALLAFCAWRLRAATRALLIEDPRVTALLDRMATPAIETAAEEREAGGGFDDQAAGPAPAALGGTARGVIWSHGIAADAVQEYARRHLGFELNAIVAAGGSPELEVDRRAADEIAAGRGPLVVFTPAWEPPLLEFLDFISALRERVGPDTSIVVTPVAEAAEPAGEVELDTWSRAVGRLADPRVYVEAGAA